MALSFGCGRPLPGGTLPFAPAFSGHDEQATARIGLMIWMWVSTIVILLGAELDVEIERQLEPVAASA